MFDHKKTFTCILALIAALMLSGCGSNGDSSNEVKYTGKTTPALIDAGNAQDITAKSLGIGFLDGSNSDLAPVSKSMEILAGPTTKGMVNPGSAPGIGMYRALSQAVEPLMNAVGPLFGEILPLDAVFALKKETVDSKLEVTFFPNTSGEGSFTSTITRTEVTPVATGNTVTYSGAITMTQATHCFSEDGFNCTDESVVDGALTVTGVTFHYTEPAPGDEPPDWADMSAFEKLLEAEGETMRPEGYESWTGYQELSYLYSLRDDDGEYDYLLVTALQFDTSGLFSIATTNKFYPVGESSDPSAYLGSSVTTYKMDGTFQKTDADLAPGMSEETGLGEEKYDGAVTFTGNIDIEMTLAAPDTDVSLVFALADSSMTFSGNWHEKATQTAGADPDMVKTESGISTLALSGNASLTFNAKTPADTLAVQADLTGGQATFTSSESLDETRSSTDAPDNPDKTDYEDAFLVSSNASYALHGLLAGNVTANAEYATTLVTPITQTLGMTLNVGQLEFGVKTVTDTTYATEDFSYFSRGNQLSRIYTTTVTSNFNGDATLTNGIEPITLLGDLAFDLTMVDTNDNVYPELDDSTVDGNLTINKLTLKAGVLDTTVKGTFAFDLEEAEINRMPGPEEDSRMLNLAMDLLLCNNLEDKTYWFNDYKLGIALYMDHCDELDANGPTISVSGRFYHPDYGYVDLATGDTPFFINFDATEEALSMGDTDLFLSSLFPLAGEMTLTGDAGSQAVMKALNTYVPELDENLSGGYTLSVDADGDGTFEAGALHAWPNLSELTENVWILRLGVDVVGWLGNLGFFERIFDDE